MRKVFLCALSLFLCIAVFAAESPYTQIISDTRNIPTDFPFDELERASDISPFVECYHFAKPDCDENARGYFYIFKNKNENLKSRFNF